MKLDDTTRTNLEAAVYRRLVEHLRAHTEVQNIDLMNLAKFCRNCLSNWMKEAADAKGVAMSKEESRELVLVLDAERTLIAASRRAREVFPGLAVGSEAPPELLEGDARWRPVVVPYELERSEKSKVHPAQTTLTRSLPAAYQPLWRPGRACSSKRPQEAVARKEER